MLDQSGILLTWLFLLLIWNLPEWAWWVAFIMPVSLWVSLLCFPGLGEVCGLIRQCWQVENHLSMSCDLHCVGSVGVHALLSEVCGLILSEFQWILKTGWVMLAEQLQTDRRNGSNLFRKPLPKDAQVMALRLDIRKSPPMYLAPRGRSGVRAPEIFPHPCC